MSDIEFVDPDGRPAGGDEELAAGHDRPPRRWPVVAAVIAIATAVTAAVLVGRDGGRTDARPDPTAVPTRVSSGPVIPDYRTLPSGSASFSQRPVNPDCPSPTSCLLRPASPAVVALVARVVRPLIADPGSLSVVDTVKPGGVVSERSITAVGGGRGLAIVVSRWGRQPDVDPVGRWLAFGHGLVGNYVVNGTLVGLRGDADSATTTLSRVCANRLLEP